MSPLVMKVKEFVEEHGLGAKPGIVAVSGGPDSVALLRAMCELNVPVTAAHVNHQLRGEESDGDEEYVKALAEQLNVPFVSTRITLPDANIEEAARKQRYEWFYSLNGNWIATGHTADDQAETTLHHIIRGTGLQGLRGILNRLTPSGTKAPSILRPMLHVTRYEVVEYLKWLKQPYRTDSSNDDPRFTRNRIRHEVIPLLKEFNPEIVSVLCHLSEQADETWRHLTKEALSLFLKVERPAAGSMLILDREIFQKAPMLNRREMLRLAWMREQWPRNRMTFDHWQRLANLEPGDYPGGIRLALTERVVQLGPRQ